MTKDEKFKKITRKLEEVLTEEELNQLLVSGTPLRHYIGFEISGKIHLGTGLICMQKVKELYDAGAEVIIFLADWHSWINNKLDGKLETASRLAKSYFAEGLKAGYRCVGGDPQTLKFVLGSELYQKNPQYWATVIKVAKATTISRMLRSTTIMGREAGLSSDTATLFYPAMQVADLFILGVNIAHAGTDQRNVHVVAREVAKELGYNKPVVLHHHLLQGLGKPPIWPIPDNQKLETVTALKMSKSKPESAIFIHDSPEEIRQKIHQAFAPEGEVEFNPLLDWVKHLVFYEENVVWEVPREEKFGGNLTYNSYQQLEADYQARKLHPMDLKNALAEWLIQKLQPAREYFQTPERQQALREIEQLTCPNK